MTDSERERAIKEAHNIAASNAYFEARDGVVYRQPHTVFDEGFSRGWDAGRSLLLERIAALEAKLAQEPNAQQAEPPPGWKTVVVPEDVGPEPDWEDVRYQAETATGIELPRAVFSIVIREVSRWMAAQQAEAQEPFGFVWLEDGEWQLGTAFNGGPPLNAKAVFTRPQPAQPLTYQQIWEDDGIMTVNGDAQIAMEHIVAFVRAVESAHGIAAKNGANLK